MKLSIFLPHKDRAILCAKTIQCYRHFFNGSSLDFEILIGEDFSYPSEKGLLKCLEETQFYNPYQGDPFIDQRTIVKICEVKNPHGGANAVSAYNACREQATGDVFLISCAEVAPLNPHFMFRALEIKQGQYIVGSCVALKIKATLKFLLQPCEGIKNHDWTTGVEWYQHSAHRNACYNFNTMITRADWDKIGGFSEKCRDNIGCEDVDFLDKIRAAKLEIITDDEMLSVHQNHYGGLHVVDTARAWS